MGAYLSQPKTDKVSTDDIGERLIVGASSMQGWRNSQEDAHNAIIDFDANTSFFAVYDGHGGAEVATYCADRLPDFLKSLDLYRDGKIEEALKHAFLEFDRTLLQSEVVEVLKILAGEKNVDDSEEDEEDLVELHEESDMPLNKLVEKYPGHPAVPGLQNLRNEASGSGGSKPQSPFLRGRRTAAIVAQATNKALMDPDSKPQGSSTSAAAAASIAALNNDDNPSSSGSSKLLENRAEPVEDSTVSSSSSSSKTNNNITHNINTNPEAEAEAATLNGTTASASSTAAEAAASSSKADSSHAVKESGQNGSVTSSDKSITSSAATSSKAPAVDEATVSGSNDAGVAKQNGSINSSHESAKIQADGAAISSTTSKSAAKPNELSGMPQIDDDEEDDEYEFNKQAADESADSDDDDDDEDADSEEFDEEAEEDEDEDDEVLIANQQFCANMIEEPGKDSGCTAVVAVLHGRDLYVANAGDSRCVVCRNGKAIEMSLDHKPEDDEESARIIKAGGRVTQDGRVNGGLNLSRAIGDHAYKMNADLSLEEQMISAQPDVKKLIITPEDEFMILACDGIWNFMSSEEVVEFVRARLLNENKRASEICEELFDHCLAPNTMGDGTGCDNMTAVIVRFQPKILELPTRLNPGETEDALLKKDAENIVAEADEANQEKKAQKRLAENTNEAEQAMKTKRLKTDIIDGSGDDAEKPNNIADSYNMEIESPAKTAASCSTTTTANAASTAEEQNQCDSVASTVQQPTAPTAVSTTATSRQSVKKTSFTHAFKKLWKHTCKTQNNLKREVKAFKIDSLTLDEGPKRAVKEGVCSSLRPTENKVNFVPAKDELVLVAHTGSSSRTMSGDQRMLKGHPSQYVKLNVGGRLYYTTIGTLTKHDNDMNMLSAMFSGRMEVLTDSEGWILIDRCGTHFGTILNFLRDGSVPLPESHKEIAELLAEAKYYCITELAMSCERALLSHQEPKAICRIPLITSQKEENMLISNSTKPAVILVVQRQNNKYSYTSTSDDNLLKNIELFDKLSLRFNERILFIKDVIGPSEICCWSFYGHGKKVAEVCCTSIVYATDRKHTKVEFPEARIYEETLQVLLYENRNAPDQELLQATSSVRGGAAGAMHQYTSDEEEERTGLNRLRSNKRNNPT